MQNEKRLIDVAPFMKTGWHLVRTGKSNEHLASLSLADVPTVDAVEVVRGWWDKYEDDKFMGYDANGRIQYRKVYTYYCGRCGRGTAVKTNYCPNCGADMRERKSCAR